MTTPLKHARGIQLLIKIGDGASPEQFTQYCSVNTQRGITFTAGTNDQDVIDCDDPEALAWVIREKTNLSVTINGSGTVNTPDIETFFDFLVSPDPRNCQVIVDVPSADGGLGFEGALHLTEFTITGNRGEKMSTSMTMVSDGIISKFDPS